MMLIGVVCPGVYYNIFGRIGYDWDEYYPGPGRLPEITGYSTPPEVPPPPRVTLLYFLSCGGKYRYIFCFFQVMDFEWTSLIFSTDY